MSVNTVRKVIAEEDDLQKKDATLTSWRGSERNFPAAKVFNAQFSIL